LTDPGSISVVTVNIGPEAFLPFLHGIDRLKPFYTERKPFEIFERNPEKPKNEQRLLTLLPFAAACSKT